MKLRYLFRRTLWTLPASLLVAGSLSGCNSCGCGGGLLDRSLERTHCDKCATITPGAIPEPNGAHVRRFQDTQAGKAEADDFIFYQNEWRGKDLGPYGQYHLSRVIPRLPTVPYPIVVQISIDPALNEARRGVIIAALANAGIADAPSRVIVAYPEVEGLDGAEAERIYLESLQNYGGYGNQGGSFGNFGRNFGGYGGMGGLGGFGGGRFGGFGLFGF
jgi:hypothetical protein